MLQLGYGWDAARVEEGSVVADEYITVGEARARLGVSGPKMAQLIREGVLTTAGSPLDKRVKLVRVADVEALMARWSKSVA